MWTDNLPTLPRRWETSPALWVLSLRVDQHVCSYCGRLGQRRYHEQLSSVAFPYSSCFCSGMYHRVIKYDLGELKYSSHAISELSWLFIFSVVGWYFITVLWVFFLSSNGIYYWLNHKSPTEGFFRDCYPPPCPALLSSCWCRPMVR